MVAEAKDFSDWQSDQYCGGWVAGISFVQKDANPHKPMSLKWKNWNHGWEEGSNVQGKAPKG